jgi:Tfp pilus assembly protein PilF
MSLRVVLLAILVFPVVAGSSFCQTKPEVAGHVTDSPEGHLSLAQQYLRQQQPELAISEFEKVIASDPQNLDARTNLGVLLFFRRDFKGAVPQLRAACEIKPDLWKQRALLGLAEAQLQEKDASRSDLEAAFPHITDQKFQLDVGKALIDNYTATGDLDKAATIVSDLLQSRPTDTSLLYLSYRLYSDLAGRAMLTLALSAPDSAEMHEVMARELARHGDNNPAIANYREAIKINPNLPDLHFELGDLLNHATDESEKAGAAAEFKAALALNPKDDKSELALGMLAEKAGDLKTALADDSRAVQDNPDNADACTELAKILLQMDQKVRAQQLLERAIQIDPTNFVAHYRLAALYRQQGKTEEARQQVAQYQKYKQMKDKLEKIFQDMRVATGKPPADDDIRATQ